MNMIARGLLIVAATLMVGACATAKGAAIGGGIGAITGDAGKGAAIGASVGAVVDIVH